MAHEAWRQLEVVGDDDPRLDRVRARRRKERDAGRLFPCPAGRLLIRAVGRALTSRTAIDAKKRPISATALRWALALAIGVGLLLIVVSICTYIVPGVPETPQEVRRYLGWGAVGALFLLAVLSVVGDSNRLSPHYFYRDRLAEAYLYTDQLRPGKTSLDLMRDSVELPLSDLHYTQPAGAPPARTTAPLHLVSAAINLAGSRDLTRKDRKSGYFVFSKFFCGSRHTGFRPTAEYSKGDVKFARAVTISGAAASSGIGSGTFFAQAFATVLFNLRLGYWMPNPAKASSAGRSLNDRWHFWPKWLWREVTMGTDERHSLVNLSDGGHTGDNVGIYPLLQRRCKLIIACDAECDSSLTFGSFTEALRHAYIDLGIDVDIDLTMLRPDKETGMSRSHSAVGLIRYPAAAGQPRQVGYLVYLKNSLTGDEPEPVLNYKSNNPPFPHESTADQFFDDDQFESYRALGVHIAEHAFAQWVHGAPFARWRQSAQPVARPTY
jgi:multisubunit Na+/H+ antiporter MnhB subunit